LNVVIMGATSRLLPLVRLVPGVLDTHYALSPDPTLEADVFVLDQVDPERTESVIKTFRGKRIVMIFSARNGLDQTEYKTVRELCQCQQIPLITDIADEQVIEELERSLFPHRLLESSQSAVALIGCHRKAGITTLAEAITKCMQEKIEGTVGWVDVNPYAFPTQTHNESHWGNLYQEYEAGVLSPKRIRETAIRQENGVYRIVGNAKLESARLFKPQLMEQMLNMIIQTFDWTLFTIHPYWDNSMTLVPLSVIQHKVLVTTSKVEDMNEFYTVQPQLQFSAHLDLKGLPYVYNMDGLDNETNGLVAAKLESESIATIPYLPRLQAKDHHELKGILGPLVQQWVKDFSLQQKPSLAERSSRLSRWFRK
jgi:hypothetical protein